MRPGQDRDDRQDEGNELRVTDRRRFTASGDMRDESEPAPPAAPAVPEAPPPPPPAPPPVAPAPPEHAAGHAEAQPDAGADRHGAAAPVFDLGVEAVFYVFYQSALIALGASPPGGPPPHVDLAEARQAITFLKVLEDKTRGNLTAEEAATLHELLSEAQMAFVQVARKVAGGRP